MVTDNLSFIHDLPDSLAVFIVAIHYMAYRPGGVVTHKELYHCSLSS